MIWSISPQNQCDFAVAKWNDSQHNINECEGSPQIYKNLLVFIDTAVKIKTHDRDTQFNLVEFVI